MYHIAQQGLKDRLDNAKAVIVQRLTLLKLVVLMTFAVLLCSSNAMADTYFNPAFLSEDVASVADLSRFEQGKQQPGQYYSDIYVNEQFVLAQDIEFIDASESIQASSGLIPCLNIELLQQFNISPDKLSLVTDERCVFLNELIPEAIVGFNFNTQRLDINIPQAWLTNQVKGYIPVSEWDQGINAATLNYSFSGNNDDDGNNQFLLLNSGINLGAWRFRNNSSWVHNRYKDQTHQQWSSISSYAQRALIPLKSELIIGDSHSSSAVYDSLGFRGIRLYSAEQMYPDTLQGFAPTVRGIANSRARISVKQNGYVVYQTQVPPGPFVLSDLSPTMSSGDLEVNIEEEDGSSRSFQVPYSTIPILQREARIKYDLLMGDYRSGHPAQDNPFFIQATVLGGFSHGVTLYNGTQLSENYKAFTAGMGKNFGRMGALSVDGTHAKTTLADDSKYSGQSYRFLYAKSLNDWGTTFHLLGYRYSTKGFYTLDEAAYNSITSETDTPLWNASNQTIYSPQDQHNLNYRRKGRFQFNMNQRLSNYGSLYISTNFQNYWNTDLKNQNYQVGYANHWRSLNYSLSWSLTESLGLSDRDQMLALNLSMPMSALFKSKSNSKRLIDQTYMSANVSQNSNGNTVWQTGLSGTLLEDRNLSYTLMQHYNDVSEYAASAAFQYKTPYANFGAGYSSSNSNSNTHYEVSGGILAHANGVTFGQPLGDTNILVQAPGAVHVALENQTGVSTDYRGYAVMPYATVYRKNRVALDTNTMRDNTEILNNVKSVVPTQGAIVRASFDTKIGYRVLLNIQHQDRSVPFGASIVEKNSGVMSIVGEQGQAYLSGLPLKGLIVVEWGNRADAQCSAHYDLSNDKPAQESAMRNIQLQCE